MPPEHFGQQSKLGHREQASATYCTDERPELKKVTDPTRPCQSVNKSLLELFPPLKTFLAFKPYLSLRFQGLFPSLRFLGSIYQNLDL